jgi:hypothetical protein
MPVCGSARLAKTLRKPAESNYLAALVLPVAETVAKIRDITPFRLAVYWTLEHLQLKPASV